MMDEVKLDLQEYIRICQPEYIVMNDFFAWRVVRYPTKRIPRLSSVGEILRDLGYTKRLHHLRRRKGNEPGLSEMRWYAAAS